METQTMTGTAPEHDPVAGASTRLINIDNGGTLTDVCVIAGDEVLYTKTLTTPFDLSSCLFDGLTKASAVVYGTERLAALLQTTGYIRYSTTQGTNALVQRKGPRLGLLVADPAVYARLAETRRAAVNCSPRSSATGARPSTIESDDEALSAQLVRQINDLASRGASRVVVSVGGEDGASTSRRGSSDCCCGCIPGTCSARSRCCSRGSSRPTETTCAAPGRACSTRFCIRRWSGFCSAPRTGSADTERAVRC